MTLDLQTEQTDPVGARDLEEDTPEQALLAALVALSQEAHLAAHERLAWEIAPIYRYDSLSAEALLRQMNQLEECWTAARVRRVPTTPWPAISSGRGESEQNLAAPVGPSGESVTAGQGPQPGDGWPACPVQAHRRSWLLFRSPGRNEEGTRVPILSE